MRALSLLLLVACKGGGDLQILDTNPPPDPLVEIDRYDPEHLTVVEATLPEAEWDALTQESRLFYELIMGPDCFDEPVPQVFEWHPGDVLIDGEALAEVGFRKKGLIGSMSWVRPSLKVDADRYVSDQIFMDGTKSFTFNNNNQDPSRIHTCLAYSVFRRAGVPAPRCSLATMEVNGEDLGVYSNVEPIKGPFLRENFGSDEGELYEGTASDFNDEWLVTFDIKTDGATLEPLQELADAIQLPDGQLMGRLEEILDVDGFITEWAVESLVGHWDGYAQGSNNYYVYHDPSDGRLRFIPWGADSTFESVDDEPMYAASLLVTRLWNHPEGRSRYLAESQRLLDEVWDEDWLQAEVDRMEDLIAPHLLDASVTTASIDGVRAFIDARRASVQSSIDGPPEHPFEDKPKFCFEPIGSLQASFATVWGSQDEEDPFGQYPSEYSGMLEGVALEPFLGASTAGIGEEGEKFIAVLGVDESFETLTAIYILIPDELGPGTYPLDIAAIPTYMFTLDLTIPDAEPQSLVMLGGELVLEQASYGEGDAISGTLDAILLPSIF